MAEDIPQVPLHLDWPTQDFLNKLRNAVLKQQQSIVPPRPVVNVTVTPGPGSNLIQFTRSDGSTYALYGSSQPTLNGAVRIDLGLANHYTDNVGQAAVKRYYWLKTKLGNLESIAVGPFTGTTLALTAASATAVPPAGSETPATSDETGVLVPGRPTSTTYSEDL